MRASSGYKTIAVATTFSPRFKRVLAEAKRIRDRFGAELQLIHVGKRDQETPRKFTDVLAELGLAGVLVRSAAGMVQRAGAERP